MNHLFGKKSLRQEMLLINLVFGQKEKITHPKMALKIILYGIPPIRN